MMSSNRKKRQLIYLFPYKVQSTEAAEVPRICQHLIGHCAAAPNSIRTTCEVSSLRLKPIRKIPAWR